MEGFLEGKSQCDFLNDTALQRIAEREIEIIGECLNRLSRDHQVHFLKIHNAHKIIGMRNIIAHGYDSIDYRIVWDSLVNDLPTLKEDVKGLGCLIKTADPDSHEVP